jgi:hypothetical protein
MKLSRCETSYSVDEWDETELVWGQDYPSDFVAHYIAGCNDDVAKMFDYIEFKSDDTGFECYINANDALIWIKENRPHLLDEIRKHWAEEHDLAL